MQLLIKVDRLDVRATSVETKVDHLESDAHIIKNDITLLKKHTHFS